MSHAELDNLLARGRPVMLDGAVGSELLRRGVKTALPLWSAHALLTAEGVATLRAIHTEYAHAGAEILTTNTFRTSRRVMRQASRESEWRAVNQLAVEVAQEAARSVAPSVCLVAGGIAPLEDCYRPDLAPPEEQCYREHREQTELLAGLGADLLIVETMSSGHEVRAALRAAIETGLDVIVSLCPKPPAHLLSGEPLETLVPDLLEIGGKQLCGLALNCATPEVMDSVYPRLTKLSRSVPHGLYAHMGEPDDEVGWKLSEDGDPASYAAWMTGRVTPGTGFVGGCCGTTPEHISMLRGMLQ